MADEKLISAKRDKLAASMRHLKSLPEWKDFARHIEETVAAIHEKEAVMFLAKDRIEDAKRRSWIVEGLMEAIEEPDNIVSQNDFDKGLLGRIGGFCALCGQAVANKISALKAGKNEGKGEKNV